MRLFIFGCLIFCALFSDARAADPDLNDHMLKAYRMLLGDPNRALQGYNLSSYFTRDMDYGNEQGAIKATAPLRARDEDGNFIEPTATHKTMCNAAVTETIVEAINSYARAHPGWSPAGVIPVVSWNKKGFALLKSHMFTEDLTDYPPLGPLKKKAKEEGKKFEIPSGLLEEIRELHSEKGMAYALEKFRIGRRVDFKDAKPGDIVTFDRTDDSLSGPKYSGHSVVFLGFVNRKQNVVDRYDAGDVIGFKYFSSQGGGAKGTGGLSERWAYFKGMCPVRPGHGVPLKPKQKYCKDRIDNEVNRARRPFEKAGQTTDCCLNPINNPYGPRVGRLFSPEQWGYKAAQAEMQKRLDELMPRIFGFVKGREEASARIALLAKGAVAIQASSPRAAERFVANVQRTLAVDARAVARGDVVPSVSPRQANEISRATPRAVIDAANRQVTTEIRKALDRRILSTANEAVAKLESGEAMPIPNPKIDSSHVD